MRKMRWGVIGAGAIVRASFMPAVQMLPEHEVVAVKGVDEAEGAAFASEFGVPSSHVDAADLVGRQDVDAVYVATPVYLHREHALAAADAGKHVLCEKPLGMNTAECKEIIAACREAGVVVAAAYYRRFFPHVVLMREVVSSGALGTLTAIHATWSGWYPQQKGDTGPGAWRIDPAKSGGGVLSDVGCHRLDALIHLAGNPVQVMSYCDALAHDWDVEDISSLLIRFEGGAHGLLTANGGCRTGCDRLECFGTEGRMIAESLGGETVVLNVRNVADERSVHSVAKHETHVPVLQDFADAVQTGRAPVCTGEEGIKTTQIMDAAYLSSKLGRAVNISEVA